MPFGIRRVSPGCAVCLIACIGTWLGCEPPIALPEPTPKDQDPVEDSAGPLLETFPIIEPQSLAGPLTFEAEASDPSGVYAVFLHFKLQNTDWTMQRMNEGSDFGLFYVELEASRVSGSSSVSYYLEAADAAPYHNTSYSPPAGPENPYKFNIIY